MNQSAYKVRNNQKKSLSNPKKTKEKPNQTANQYNYSTKNPRNQKENEKKILTFSPDNHRCAASEYFEERSLFLVLSLLLFHRLLFGNRVFVSLIQWMGIGVIGRI